MTTLINLNGDSRTLSDIDEELSVVKEKKRVMEEVIKEFDQKRQMGDAMIDLVKEKMREEGEDNKLTSALGDKIMELKKVQTYVYDKSFALRSEYSGLQHEERGIQDEYIALAKCLLVPRM